MILTGTVLAVSACTAPPHSDSPPGLFSITEGTNFAAAASPDGRTLVIDLLGALWTMPADGGSARRLTTDLPIEARQPAFSPAGDEIAFQGFDEQGWDIWSIRRDGTGAKRLTTGPFDDREPHWSHDGTRIAFASDRQGGYDIWILDRRDGRLVRLTTNAAEDFAPAWSPDDREIAFVSTRDGGGVWAIGIESGTERRIAAVRGAVSAPSWTPDGQRVLYNVIADGTARLELSGVPIGSGEDVFPFRAHWLSRSEFLYTADGRIKKRHLERAAPETVDFTASVQIASARYARQRRDFDSATPRPVRGIVRPVISPDGRRVAFAALGDLWLMPIGSKPARLTNDRFLDTHPAWSRDGSKLVFSSDRDGKMDLWIRDMATGRERRLTDSPAAAMNPAWSPDGRHIAFVSTGAGYLVDVSIVDVTTGKVRPLRQRLPTTSEPTWSADGRTVLVGTVERTTQRFNDGFNRMLALAIDGGSERFLPILPDSAVIDSRIAEGPIWSPDGRRLAFVNGGLLRTVDVDAAGTPSSQPRQLTSEIAHAPSWTGDSKRILYLANDELKIVAVDDGRTERVPLELDYTPAIPTTAFVVHAGHVWNGRDDDLQADRDIVVEGHRIKSVEAHRPALHSGRVVDAAEDTVIPGLFDLHSHMYDQYGEALGRLMVSYGITTARDPGSIPYRSQELREAYEAGVRIGPRLFTSGNALDGDRTYFPQFYAIRSQAQLEMAMERNKRLGDEWFKLYIRLPDAMQRRAVEFAHRAGMSVASHDIFPALTFGLDGVEHVGGGNRRGFQKVSAIGNTYGDVIQLMIRSGATFTPTLSDDMSMGFDLVALEDRSLLDDERMRLLMPAWALTAAHGRVDRLAETGPALRAQTLARHGQMVKTLVRAGVVVGAGTDAPNIPQGLGIHTELALYVRGGLTPLEALRTATIGAAKVLGVDAELGTIAPGRLADLVIVGGNPLADVGNARNVRMVIKNGEVLSRRRLLAGDNATESPRAAR